MWLSGVYFDKGTGAKSQEAVRIRAATDDATIPRRSARPVLWCQDRGGAAAARAGGKKATSWHIAT